MITIPVFCIIFGCSPTTARRRIKEIYEASGVQCPETTRIPLSLLKKYKGVTKEDVEFAMKMYRELEEKNEC